MTEKWNITLRVRRQKEGEATHFDELKTEVNPDEYVLDAVERAWAFHDRTICFRHACHHSTCGACGMRVNGVEKLTCITLIRDVTHEGGTLKVAPLRNFPVVSDLVVDMGLFYRKMEKVAARAVLPVTEAQIEKPASQWDPGDAQYLRLSDCIECGLCISACPVLATTPEYLGPAPLAAAQDRRADLTQDVVENRADNYWDLEPEKTIALMQEVQKPWIAFKVLAAGAIRPDSGFKYAFANGADFICVGMFDFQVEQNVALVRNLVPQMQSRERAWLA